MHKNCKKCQKYKNCLTNTDKNENKYALSLVFVSNHFLFKLNNK